MTNTGRTAATTRTGMDPLRRTAFIAGVMYLITFAGSIPARFYFLDPVLSDPDYVVGPGADTRVLVGGLLDLVTALAGIASAVVLFRVVKRQNETLALGLVTSRLLEAAIMAVGVVSLFAVVTLRQDLGGASGADAAALTTVGSALVAAYEWTFLLGPGVMPVVNALLLGTLMYRSGLVPRVIPLLGLIGAPLLLTSNVATMFGVNDATTVWSLVGVAPIFFWELSLGIWLTVMGFRPSPITAGMTSDERGAELSRP